MFHDLNDLTLFGARGMKKKTQIRFKPYSLIFLALTFCAISQMEASLWADESKITEATVTLIIDYSDGVEKRFTRILWKQDMTIFDVMRAAQAHPRGLRYKSKGSGATTFLQAIDGLENEGQGMNWIFRVNGKLGDRSFAVTPVQQADTVLWKFGAYQ